MSEYRIDPPEPVCPICRRNDAVIAEPHGPMPWFCQRDNAAFNGSQTEAQNHAAASANAWAEREAARAAVARRRADDGGGVS